MSAPPFSYATINQAYGPEDIKEKGSRFISYLHPVKYIEGVNEILHALRKQYHDATHICYAYRLGEGVEGQIRYNDDGEPSGTAGVPIYNELKGKNYYNVLLAVVRYFGGTKLGTGGLARAYQEAAKKIILVSKEVICKITRSMLIESPFEFQDEIHKLLDRYSISTIKETYSSNGVSTLLEMPLNLRDTFEYKLMALGKGKIKVKED